MFVWLLAWLEAISSIMGEATAPHNNRLISVSANHSEEVLVSV